MLLCRLTVVAAGAAAGKFLHYEQAAPAVAAQTAYGIEAEVEGYEDNYDAESMLFMDFRRHHTGLWPNTAHKSVATYMGHLYHAFISHELQELKVLPVLLLFLCTADIRSMQRCSAQSLEDVHQE